MTEQYERAFQDWYIVYRRNWQKSEDEAPDSLATWDAWKAAVEYSRTAPDKPLHIITSTGCSICGTDALHCSFWKTYRPLPSAPDKAKAIEALAKHFHAKGDSMFTWKSGIDNAGAIKDAQAAYDAMIGIKQESDIPMKTDYAGGTVQGERSLGEKANPQHATCPHGNPAGSGGCIACKFPLGASGSIGSPDTSDASATRKDAGLETPASVNPTLDKPDCIKQNEDDLRQSTIHPVEYRAEFEKWCPNEASRHGDGYFSAGKDGMWAAWNLRQPENVNAEILAVLEMLSKKQIATWYGVRDKDGNHVGGGYYAGWDDAEYAVKQALTRANTQLNIKTKGDE